MGRLSNQQLDIFVASATDVANKQHRELMARNWFSLSKRYRTEEILHEFDGNYVRVTGSEEHGIATIFDNDILLFVIAQYMRAVNDGQTDLGRTFAFNGYEFFKFIGKQKFSGKGYDDLWAALNRLHHTFVETNITLGEGTVKSSFNWLSAIKRNRRGAKDMGFEIVIAEWLHESIVDKKWVLTLDDGYFGLTGGLERWLYLYARKSAGYQKGGWAESIDSLYKKSGVLSTKAKFKYMLKRLDGKTLVKYDISMVIGKNGEDGIYFERTDDARKKIADVSVALEKSLARKRRGAITFRETG
jgi:plasmid replication initiation protein